MMVDEGFKTREQILADLRISAHDVEELCGLKSGYLSDASFHALPRPRFSTGADTEENIVLFLPSDPMPRQRDSSLFPVE
jgi:hypothetical protein